MKFQYVVYSVNPSVMIPDGVVFAPEVPVTVIGPIGDEILLSLVDSGGDFTLFPDTIVDRLLVFPRRLSQ